MTDSRILSIALSAIREGRDIVVIAIDRDDAELLAEQIIQRAAAEGLCVAESIGDQYELCSEVPLIYARAYEQECATWEGRTRRPLVAVRHSSAMSLEALSYRPPTFRRVLGMKTYTQFVREGELLGPVDWSYDFRSHFFGPTRACNSDDNNQRRMDRAMGVLRAIARNDSTEPTAEWIVTTNGFAHPLLAVGMYDGWPFWKPTPAVLYRGVLGPERAFFYELEKAVTP